MAVDKHAGQRRDVPAHVFRLGEEPRDDLTGVTTAEQRIEMVTELTRRYWELSGQPWPSYVRAEMPVRVIQLGLPPNRIDLLTSISGVPDFAVAWRDRSEHDVRGRRIPFLGREALIRNKRATGRRKDLADIEALGEDPTAST